MKAQVLVRLKAEVSDPAGAAIRDALLTLGHGSVRSVRAGKVFDLELDETDPVLARQLLEEIGHEILSNPVIEDFGVEITEESPS